MNPLAASAFKHTPAALVAQLSYTPDEEMVLQESSGERMVTTGEADETRELLSAVISLLKVASNTNKTYLIERITCGMIRIYLRSIIDLKGTILNASFWASAAGKSLLSIFPSEPDHEHHLVSTSSDEAFKTPYQKQDTIPSALLDFAERCLSLWNADEYYSPYAAVINASMTGKSRAFAQLPEEGIFVFRICFQKPGSLNSPARSPHIADWFVDRSAPSQRLYAAFIVAALDKLSSFVEANYSDELINLTTRWYECQDEEFWKEVTAQAELYDRQEPIDEGGTEAVDGMPSIGFGNLPLKAFHALEYFKAHVKHKMRRSVCRVLFFFDEASALTTLVNGGPTRFQVLRRALRVLKGSHSCFAFFTDTISKIANFAPAATWERSFQILKDGLKLFPPFWWLPTMDVWPDTKGSHFTVAELEQPECFFRYGRPGYYAFWRTQQYVAGAIKIIDILSRKLLSETKGKDITLEQALAILGVRVALTVNACSHVARNLTASHMRLCVGVSEDRESVFTYQYAEPALAYAAMTLTHRFGWLSLLDLLRGAMAATYTQTSHRGVIGAQMLLLMAADRFRVEQSGDDMEAWLERVTSSLNVVNIPTIPLSRFIAILTGSAEEISDDNFSARISCMYVRLIQFVQVFAKPGKSQLCEMFNRACGIVVKPGSQQVDLILPTLILKEGEQLEDVIPIPDRMSAVLVQIKCYTSPRSSATEISLCSVNLLRGVCTETETAGDKLNEYLDYVSLLIEVGPLAAGAGRCRVFNRAKVEQIVENFGTAADGLQVDQKQLSVSIYGLRPDTILPRNYPLVDDITKSFQALMTQSFNPETIQGSSDEAIRNLKLSIGLVYQS